MCSSLLLSILRQVLEDKDESVRETAIKNLSLVISRVNNEQKISDVRLSEPLIVVISDLKANTPHFSYWMS